MSTIKLIRRSKNYYFVICKYLGTFKGENDSENVPSPKLRKSQNHTQASFLSDLDPKREQPMRFGACCKISKNKSCYNFGFGHEITYCIAVKKSQIRQP